MITLIHGDYIEASRRELNRLKDKATGKEIIMLDGAVTDETDLIQAVESSSLLSFQKLVVIESIFSKNSRNTQLIAKFTSLLAKTDGVDIILWEQKELTPSIMRKLGNTIVNRLFKVPPRIFTFLDGIRPGNASMLLPIYRSLITNEPSELVFAMLVKRIRQLIQVKDQIKPVTISPWQLSRLTMQSNSFTMEKLTGMYKKLLTIEQTLRTGVSPFTLSQQIELFIINL